MKQTQRKLSLPKVIVCLCCSLALLANTALGDTITVADQGRALDAGNWKYTYKASASNTDLVPDGGAAGLGTTYIVVYDFAGYIGGSATSPFGWTFFGTSALGPVPVATAAPDSAAIDNLIWEYTGAAQDADVATVIDLGFFSAKTTLTGDVLGWYGAQDHNYVAGPTAGAPSGAVGQVHVPTGAAVPEGGLTLTLLGFAFVGLESLRRKLSFVK